MNVLLVNVPCRLGAIGESQDTFHAVRNDIPPLGLAYLAAVAERGGHAARILDEAQAASIDRVREEARDFDADVVGLSASTPAFPGAMAVARVLRQDRPATALVLGGPHGTALPEAAARTGAFDYIVVGEGEETFAQLLERLSAGTDAAGMAGLAAVRDGQVVMGPARARIPDLDSLPLPARHLLPPLRECHPTPASCRRLPLAHVMTSRGCPSRCKFCDRAVFGEQYRVRSSENVLAEIDELVGRHGAREIRFFDDTFTLNRPRLEEICQGLRRRHHGLPWTCLTKVAAVDLDMLRMMRASGCWQVLYGLESGDDRILASLGKRNTVAQNRQAVGLTRKAGLRVRADFLVGSPHETMESLEATLQFAKDLPLDFAHFNRFVPYPGTEFYQELTAAGMTFDFTTFGDQNDISRSVFVPPAIAYEDYVRFLSRAYREFYHRPTYILRRLLGMRTFTEFSSHVRAFGPMRRSLTEGKFE